MARTDTNPQSWRATKKNIKTTSQQHNITKPEVKEWIHKVEAKQRRAISTSSVLTRRNPGRMDGVRWNGDSFICPNQVGESEWTLDDVYGDVEEVWDQDFEWREREERPLTVCLADIAKPMKRKGAAKDFEVVDKVKAVITWESDTDMDSVSSDDLWEADWEDLVDEDHVEPRQSYADALRGAG